MGFVYSSGRRYGHAPRVFQVLKDGTVRVAIASSLQVVPGTTTTFENMDDFIATLGGTTKEPKRKLKRRVKKSGDEGPATSEEESDES